MGRRNVLLYSLNVLQCAEIVRQDHKYRDGLVGESIAVTMIVLGHHTYGQLGIILCSTIIVL